MNINEDIEFTFDLHEWALPLYVGISDKEILPMKWINIQILCLEIFVYWKEG